MSCDDILLCEVSVLLKTDLEANLPLTESTFLILLSLAPGPRHGYAIMKDVAALSGDRVQLSTGTLYGALKRLLAQDWIQRAQADPPPESGARGARRPRKAYVLTELGRRVLDAEVARLQTLVGAADLRISEARA
jgi:DNA-binding PadR family transcriptional regulator